MASRPVRWLVVASVVAAGAMSLVAATTASSVAVSAPAPGSVAPHPFISDPINGKTLTFPPTTAYCLANLGLHCYQPAQFIKAYNLAPLHNAGITGAGTTIVIVDSFGSPTIANDLHVFD
jgi:subtilase family serine protease